MSVIADNDDPVPAASASSALPAAPSLVTPPDERDTRTRDRSRSRSPGYRSRDVPPPRSNFRPDSRRHGATEPTPSRVLGVFALSIRTRERDLEEEFGRYGTVEKAIIVYDQRESDRSRGFGFVTMSTVEEATKCIQELNGIELNDRRIRVDYSLTDRPHSSTPGEYMGYRRDRDRGGGGGGRGGDYRGGGGGGGRYERSSRYDDRRGDDRSSSWRDRDDRRDYDRRDRDRDHDRRGGDRDSRRRSPEYTSGSRRYSRSPSPRPSARSRRAGSSSPRASASGAAAA